MHLLGHRVRESERSDAQRDSRSGGAVRYFAALEHGTQRHSDERCHVQERVGGDLEQIRKGCGIEEKRVRIRRSLECLLSRKELWSCFPVNKPSSFSSFHA